MRLTTSRLETLARDRMPDTPTAPHGHPTYVAECAICRVVRDDLVQQLYPARRPSVVFVEVAR